VDLQNFNLPASLFFKDFSVPLPLRSPVSERHALYLKSDFRLAARLFKVPPFFHVLRPASLFTLVAPLPSPDRPAEKIEIIRQRRTRIIFYFFLSSVRYVYVIIIIIIIYRLHGRFYFVNKTGTRCWYYVYNIYVNGEH